MNSSLKEDHSPQSDKNTLSSASRASKAFHILTKPTGSLCNLDCTYCFYLGKAALYPEQKQPCMSLEVLERLTKEYIESQPKEVKEINFAWQGGEPTLMGVDFFRTAVSLQKKYTPQGVTITNSFQTNGVLLDDEWAQFFKEEKFLVGISIDGPKCLHDKYRKNKGGEATFAEVVKGLEKLKTYNAEFNTLTVVNQTNGKQPEKVYSFLKEIGSRFMQFIPLVTPARKGNAISTAVYPKQFGRFMNGIFDCWIKDDVGHIFVQYFDMLLGIVMGYPSSLCVHAETCGRAVALEHNGDLYSCDHFVDTDYKLGNIMDKSLKHIMDGAFQEKFGNDKYDTLPQYCKKCLFLNVCYGGCPAHRILKTPDGEPGLNYLCEGYKDFYGHTLPYFRAMAECLRRRMPASEYGKFLLS